MKVNVDNEKHIEKQPKPKQLFILLALLGIGLSFILFMIFSNKPVKKTKSEPLTEQTTTQSSTKKTEKKEQTQEEKAAEAVAKVAKETGRPYDTETKPIGAGYTFSDITYDKDDSNRQTKVKQITAPEIKEEQSQDEVSTAIISKLSSQLPVIEFAENKRMITKDASKVSFEIYNKENNQHLVIMFFDGQPFGYIDVAEDGTMTPTLASNAVTDVADQTVGNEITGTIDQYLN